MISRVTARAYANIALCKYWGKYKEKGNLPATPSISLALDVLQTETEVCRIKGDSDKFKINGRGIDELTYNRLVEYLDLWRRSGLIRGHFNIESKNNFPANAGLASSSSGFAALAMALSGFADRRISKTELSRLARLGSGSASRSIPGGLAKLPAGDNPAASIILPFDKVPWGMVAVMVKSGAKKVGSREGMRLTSSSSPFYKAWISRARRDYRNMLAAIKVMDFKGIGRICEDNALAMHACMIATRPSLMYWTSATLEIIRSVAKWRDKGLETYYTIDAGPHVLLLGRLGDLGKIAGRARRIKGAVSVLIGKPAGGARITGKS